MTDRDPMAGLDRHLEESAGYFLSEKPDPEIDCQGEGGPDCKCRTCKTYCCPNCHTYLYKPWAQYYNCPECGTIMDSYDQDGGLR